MQCRAAAMAMTKPLTKHRMGLLKEALHSWQVMDQRLDTSTYLKYVHEEITRRGFQSDVFVASTLVDMYTKCGSIENARDVFDKMPQRDTVSWNTMISGYAFHGHVDEALELFQKMPQPNVISWTAMIGGYAQNGHGEEALNFIDKCNKLGMEIHEQLNRSGFQSNVFVGSALVDMYAKCGSIEKACNVFDKIHQPDVVSWNAMIAGYAMHGSGKEAIEIFEQMQHPGANPDTVTLVCVLAACCHAGLVDKGQQYFNHMSHYYHITPTMEHYGCMVDLLGRAGHLDEAQDFISKMPIKADATVWGCLLGACRIHNNIELGEHVAEHMFELNPKNFAPYVLLSNMYAAAGRRHGIEKVYAFLVGDRSHPQTEEIYAKLEALSRQMKTEGYVPDTKFVFNDVEEDQKEQILYHHSEKLAIAFGLINTSPKTTIRVIKNLRVCGDCHSAIKFISKIVAREIVVRDSHRFHHFKDGCCSCADYW
eukprot:Gb_06087 [translate_table: standard]